MVYGAERTRVNSMQIGKWTATEGAKPLLKRLKSLANKERGGMLLEMAISVMVFVLVGTALLGGLSTAHISGANTETQSDAENFARNQMEYIAALPYQPLQGIPLQYQYAVAPGLGIPSDTGACGAGEIGYCLDARGEEILIGDPNIQKVIVDVYFDGTITMTLETIVANQQ